MDRPRVSITAYAVADPAGWGLVKSSPKRDWMAAHDGFAYKCLPLTIANAAGWTVTSPVSFVCTWNGGLETQHLQVEFQDPFCAYGRQIHSHFGNGILTFNLPWLFRTSPGVALRVSGPPNAPKINCHACEGLVETDWLPFTFTMNWKMLKPGVCQFVRGEPICFLQPVSLPLIETIEPQLARLADNQELSAKYHEWSASRARNNADPNRKTSDWQKYYTSGGGSVEPPPHHRTTMALADFTAPKPDETKATISTVIPAEAVAALVTPER